MTTPTPTPADQLLAAAEKLRAARFSGAITATPTVAALIGARLPLAAWLEAEAAPPITAQHSDRCTDPQCTTLAALAVARQLIGTTEGEDTATDDTLHACPGRWAGPNCRCFDDETAAPPSPADRATPLTEAERTMLTYALNQAQEHIWSRDGFTDEDQAAVTSLRALTTPPAPADRAAEVEQLRTEMERRTLMLQASRDQVAQLTADRAAVLREAADEIAGIDFHPNARARSLDIATGLAHRLRRLAGEAAAGAHHPSPRIRCAHTDVLYGQCVRYLDDHDGDCQHEHQPTPATPAAPEEPTR